MFFIHRLSTLMNQAKQTNLIYFLFHGDGKNFGVVTIMRATRSEHRRLLLLSARSLSIWLKVK